MIPPYWCLMHPYINECFSIFFLLIVLYLLSKTYKISKPNEKLFSSSSGFNISTITVKAPAVWPSGVLQVRDSLAFHAEIQISSLFRSQTTFLPTPCAVAQCKTLLTTRPKKHSICHALCAPCVGVTSFTQISLPEKKKEEDRFKVKLKVCHSPWCHLH